MKGKFLDYLRISTPRYAIATLLKQSANDPPYNLRLEQTRIRIERTREKHPEIDLSELDQLLSNPPVAPTLLKYADARPYDIDSRDELVQAASELLDGAKISECHPVTLVRPETLETEIAATLIYGHSHYPYQQIVELVTGLSATQRREIVQLGVKHRGSHDEVNRAFASGYALQFDILMDIGGFRDMHRHRQCVQILQSYTTLHGYSIPETGRRDEAHDTIPFSNESVPRCVGIYASRGRPKCKASGDYALPLAFRRRALFKMDFAEAIYICELRTGPAGHFSYRRIAYDMFLALQEKYPDIASCIRVHDVNVPLNILQR